MNMKRFRKRKDIATLKAKEILGEKKLNELLAEGIVPIHWEIYISNTKRRCEALKKIREIVNSPTLINP